MSCSATRRRSRHTSPCATTMRRRRSSSSRTTCRRSRTISRSTPEYRNRKIGALAPIRVVNQIIAAGDAAKGVRTAAFNLPNDERVVREKGSKRVMLRNVQEAKFSSTLVPISKRVLPAAAQADLSFDSFFTHILAHELTHGIGPHTILVDGPDFVAEQAVKRSLQRSRGSESRHLRSVHAAVYVRQEAVARRRRPKNESSTPLFWPRHFVPCASAPTKRMAKGWRSSSTTSWTRARSA